MAITSEQKKAKIKSNRSQAIKSKIDLLKTRDGSDSPPIESLKDVDIFNRQQLFGASGNANIDWNHMGIEGLIRAFYNLIQKLDGTKRDNIIIDTNEVSTYDASLNEAANAIMDGRAYESGFFVGDSSSSQEIKTRANRGEFDLSGSALNNNIHASSVDSNNLETNINDSTNLIGNKSSLHSTPISEGPYIYHDSSDKPDPSLDFNDIINESQILGERFTDASPFIETSTPTGTPGTYSLIYTYGDGTYDSIAGKYLNTFKELQTPVTGSGPYNLGYQQFSDIVTSSQGASLNQNRTYTFRVNNYLYSFDTDSNTTMGHVVSLMNNAVQSRFLSCELINSHVRITNQLLGESVTITAGDSNGTTIFDLLSTAFFQDLDQPVDPALPFNYGYQKFGLTPFITQYSETFLPINKDFYFKVNGAEYSFSLTSTTNYKGLAAAITDVLPYQLICIFENYSGSDYGDLKIITKIQGGSVNIENGSSGDNVNSFNLLDLDIATSYGSGTFNGWTAHLDWYDGNLHNILNNILTLLDILIDYINITKISDQTYFTNNNCILGLHDSPVWNTQDQWISEINTFKNKIQDYLNFISQHYSGGDSTSSSARSEINTKLEQLKTDLSNFITTINNIKSTINNQFGTTSDPGKMYGFRFLWVKSILDMRDGSKIALKGISTAIDSMNKSITSAEEGFGLFGITRQSVSWATDDAWIGGLPTPEIAGIETYATIDADQNSDTFGEMIITGYIIAWDGPGHATNYNVYKSNDWDGSSGNWSLILPAGNSYTVEDIDLNTGKVITYYIDTDVDPNSGEKPFYKVIAYDTGGTNDYARIPAISDESNPKNIDDFATTTSTTPFVGPTGPPPAAPGSAPPYLFKWTTLKQGSESLDHPVNKVFKSEAEFDSIGSNLEVFVNGEIRHQGTGPDDYQILTSQEIEFQSQLSDNSFVTMIVYFAKGSGESGSWKSPVDTLNNLPTTGNSKGDIRAVLSEEKLYMWNDDFSSWKEVGAGAINNLFHTNLADMPDNSGVNADHDARYYTKDEVDDQLNSFNQQLNALQNLVPDDALPLSDSLSLYSGNFYSGYLSSGGNNNFNTLSSNTYFSNIINTENFVLILSDADHQFADADKGVLKLYINGALLDQFDLESHFNESERNTGQTWTPIYGSNSILEVTSVAPYNNYPLHQKGSIKIHINSILLNGENEIMLTHEVGGEVRSAKIVLFVDSSSDQITFSNIIVSENQLLSSKYVSGVRYYTIGDKLRVRFYVDHLFNNTYVNNNQLEVNLLDFGCDSYFDNWMSNYVTNVPSGSVDDVVTYDRVSEINQENIYNINPKLRLKGRDPFSESNEFTSSNTPYILINTYSNYSDDKNEYFVDEKYRLKDDNFDSIPTSYKDTWNSSNLLDSGELQVYNSQLIYPSIDYSNDYLPEQNVNYSGKVGTRSFIRAFIDNGVPHNNGVFFIENCNISVSSLKITIKLPSQTGWLDLSKLYNESDFSGSDGDGCLTSYDGYNFSWTSGIYSTANSGYMIVMKIEMTDISAPAIKNVSINW